MAESTATSAQREAQPQGAQSQDTRPQESQRDIHPQDTQSQTVANPPNVQAQVLEIDAAVCI